MSRKLPLGEGETARTACARGLLRTGVEEKTGEVLPAPVLAERVGWAVDLVSGMAADLLGRHWNTTDVDVLASGEDAGGRKLPSNAWMALRRLGWTVGTGGGVRVNDRIVRMAQETAGRTLRSSKWRADLTAAVIATWPANPAKRTPQEWDAVREAAPGGPSLPSSVITSRTRQIAAFVNKHRRMPVDGFEVEAAPRTARMLLLSACDGQQATIERVDGPGRALLRVQLPSRPDPRSYADWTWVATRLLHGGRSRCQTLRLIWDHLADQRRCSPTVGHHALDEWGYPLPDQGPLPRTTLKRARRAAADCPVLALKLTMAHGS